MNRWSCGEDLCSATAVGVGGATGLRAVGWQVAKGMGPRGGPLIRCPKHRIDFDHPQERYAAAEDQAAMWQERMEAGRRV